MKHLAFIVVSLALSSLPVLPQEKKDTGIDLQRECLAIQATSRSSYDYQQAAHCFGYIMGVRVPLRIWQETNSEKHLPLTDVPACIPLEATNGELVQVVLHYLDQHPNKLHMGYDELVLLALGDAYPCSAN